MMMMITVWYYYYYYHMRTRHVNWLEWAANCNHHKQRRSLVSRVTCVCGGSDTLRAWGGGGSAGADLLVVGRFSFNSAFPIYIYCWGPWLCFLRAGRWLEAVAFRQAFRSEWHIIYTCA